MYINMPTTKQPQYYTIKKKMFDITRASYMQLIFIDSNINQHLSKKEVVFFKNLQI